MASLFYLKTVEGIRGVYASQDTYTVMTIPKEDVYTPELILKLFPCCTFLNCDDYTLLTAFILLKPSQYTKYFDELPYSQDMMIYHKHNLPVHLQECLLPQKTLLKRIYKALKASLCPYHLSCLTKSQYLAAFSLMNSRCVAIQNKIVLMRNFDMMNHSFSSTTYLQVINDTIVIKSDQLIYKNQEITLCYGPHDNLFLLIEYGFILHDNPYDCIDISIVIIQLMSNDQIKELIKHSYYNDYTLSRKGLNYRAIVTLHYIETGLFSIYVDDYIPTHLQSLLITLKNDYLQFSTNESTWTPLLQLYNLHLKLINSLL